VDSSLFATMLRARRFDEAMLGALDRVDGHYHASIGLEATAAAVGACRRERDRVLTNYRNHAHLLAVGADPTTLLGEIFGRAGGPQRGRSGTFHLADPAHGVPYTSAMVGGGVPIALGVAFAQTRCGSDGLAFAFFGDGALGEGVLHESLNLAELWRLPVLFVCENNAEPTSGRANVYQSAAQLTDLAAAHGLRASAVDARHPAAVLACVAQLVEHVRAGRGPAFCEARAGSWPGNDPFFPLDLTGPTDLADATRTRGERWYDFDDPVLNEARRLLAGGVAPETLWDIDAGARAEMAHALATASTRPPAEPAAALDDVLGPQPSP
jgi:acetoin:2,6-dichlorophenolindophenol oxidoreductase subunit alpha